MRAIDARSAVANVNLTMVMGPKIRIWNLKG